MKQEASEIHNWSRQPQGKRQNKSHTQGLVILDQDVLVPLSLHGGQRALQKAMQEKEHRNQHHSRSQDELQGSIGIPTSTMTSRLEGILLRISAFRRRSMNGCRIYKNQDMHSKGAQCIHKSTHAHQQLQCNISYPRVRVKGGVKKNLKEISQKHSTTHQNMLTKPILQKPKAILNILPRLKTQQGEVGTLCSCSMISISASPSEILNHVSKSSAESKISGNK